VYATWQNPTVDAAEKASYGADATNFGKNITTLAEGTTYYVRAYAVNAMGTAYGEEVRFSTLAVTAPTLANVSVTGVSISGATASSSITNNGNADVIDAGLCWSESPYPTIYDDKISYGTGAAFSVDITGLKSGTIYYVRAYATNSKGTGYSADASFTTEDPQNMHYYVSAIKGDNANNGRSWATAKKTISAAVTAATSGYQIWVDNATYQENVTLKEGVSLYGGFSGTEATIEQRVANNKTTLLRYRFIQNTTFNTPIVVDGFTITTVSNDIILNHCNLENSSFTNNTGSITISDSDITDCSFTGNAAISLSNGSVANSTISNNSNVVALSGITMNTTATSNNAYLSVASNSTLNSCTVTNNTSYGVYLLSNNSSVINCKIQNNGSVGVYARGGSIIGCLITGNFGVNSTWMYNSTSDCPGGSYWYYHYYYYYATGIYVDAGATDVNIYNNTVVNNNQADPPTTNISGLGSSHTYHYTCAGIVIENGAINLINNIIYSTSNSFVHKDGGTLYASNNLSPINFTNGSGNIILTDINDYMLGANYAPQSGSPVINAGDNSFVSATKDVNGNTRIQGGTVDIGAVESGY
jgi:hypothetical protein